MDAAQRSKDLTLIGLLATTLTVGLAWAVADVALADVANVAAKPAARATQVSDGDFSAEWRDRLTRENRNRPFWP